MSRSPAGRTSDALLVSDLFPPPQNRIARLLQDTLRWIRTRLFRASADSGVVDLADVSYSQWSEETEADEVAEAVRSTVAWRDDNYSRPHPALVYRHLHLPDLWHNPVVKALPKISEARERLDEAIRECRPTRVLVRDTGSLEGQIVLGATAEAEVHPGVLSYVPRWMSRLEQWLWQAGRSLFTVRSGLRESYRFARLVEESGERVDERRSVLFFSPGVTSTRTTLPVLEELARRGGRRIGILYPPRMESEVLAAVEAAGRLLERGVALRPFRWIRFFRHMLSLRRVTDALREKGWSFRSASLSAILWEGPAEFSAHTIALIKTWIDFWTDRSDLLRYGVLVAGNDRSWQSAVLLRLAEREGARTIGLQDGFYVRSPVLACTRSQHFIVAGEAVRANMIQLGVEPEILRVLGLPRYDELIRGDRTPRAEVMTHLEFDPMAPLVVVATDHSVPVATKRAEALAVLDLSERFPTAQIVFKLHPYEHDGIVEAVIRQDERGAAVRVVRDYAIADLLAAADVVVTGHSSCGAEAMILGKPVIVLDLAGEYRSSPYVAEGGAFGAHTGAELEDAVRVALDGKGAAVLHARRAEFLRRYLGDLDGKSAERVADYVVALAGADAAASGDALNV